MGKGTLLRQKYSSHGAAILNITGIGVLLGVTGNELLR